MEEFLNNLKAQLLAQLQEQVNAAVKSAYDQGLADGKASVPGGGFDQAALDAAVSKALGDFKVQLKAAVDAVLAMLA